MGKTIVIENETHNALKEYSKKNSIKINAWVDLLIKEKLGELNEKI